MSSFQWEDIDPGAGNTVTGIISNLDRIALTATVAEIGENIPIHYHCEADPTDDGKPLSESYPDDLDIDGGGAFNNGDNVLVIFRRLNNQKPMIIGFPDYPRSCIWEPWGDADANFCDNHNWQSAYVGYDWTTLNWFNYLGKCSLIAGPKRIGTISNGKFEFFEYCNKLAGPSIITGKYYFPYIEWRSKDAAGIYPEFHTEDSIVADSFVFKGNALLDILSGSFDPPASGNPNVSFQFEFYDINNDFGFYSLVYNQTIADPNPKYIFPEQEMTLSLDGFAAIAVINVGALVQIGASDPAVEFNISASVDFLNFK